MTGLRRAAAAAAACSMVAAASLPASAGADKPSFGCPPGFNLGQITAQELLAHPRAQAGIQAGLFTEEGLLAFFASVDKNGNNTLCAQLSQGYLTSARPGGEFFLNFVDDNASKP